MTIKMLTIAVVGFAALASPAAAQTAGGMVSPKPGAPVVSAPTTAGTGAISGVVTDSATHQPLANVVVYLGIQGQGPVGRVSQRVTDARGRFVFDGLVASNLYFINASRFGYFDGYYGRTPGAASSSRIMLADGQWFSAADFELTKVGAIGGTVVDEFGEPVVGAYVRALVQISAGGSTQFAAGPTAKTDDRGEYRLPGLSAGKYLVVLPSAQNTVPAASTAADIEGLTPEMLATFDAAAAQGKRTPPRVNGGAIEDGNARLIIGNFVTPPPAAEGHSRAYPITFYAGGSSVASATTIELTEGEDKSGVNIKIEPLPSARISGRVEGLIAGGPKLSLRLVVAGAGAESLGAASEAATTLVEPDGSFTFLNVPAGAYTIDARQSQFEFTYRATIDYNPVALPQTPGRQQGSRVTMGPVAAAPEKTSYAASTSVVTPTYFGRTPVNVATVDVENVVVILQPTITIRGRYVYEDMDGIAPNVPPSVSAEPAGGNWALGLLASDSREALGPLEFAIHGVVPGAYHLRPGVTPFFAVKSVMLDGQDYAKRAIDAAAGQDINGVTITLTGKLTELSGVVHDAQGRAFDHAIILAFPTDRTLWSSAGVTSVWIKRALSSSAGAFSFSSLRAGEYFVVAVDGSRPIEWSDPAVLQTLTASATRIALEWGAPKTIDLRVMAVK